MTRMCARNMANLGAGFEEEIESTNEMYEVRGIALVQKVSTPWGIRREGKQISAYPSGKSTLDFIGTVKPSISISFDCKETEDEYGLPLSNIKESQIEYMEKAIKVKEVTFILCCMLKCNQRFLIPGAKVIEYWQRWKQNYRKKGYNYIPREDMILIKSRNGIVTDYLQVMPYLMELSENG